MKQELFVVFEGMEGVGKTTLLQECAKELNRNSIETVTVTEFSDSPIGAYLKRRLHSDPFLREPGSRTALTQIFVIAADTAYAVEHSVKSLIERDVVVLKERYRDSIVACQHISLVDEYGWNEDQAVNRLIELAGMIIVDPDLTLYLHAPEVVRMRRLGKRKESARLTGQHAIEIMRRRAKVYDKLYEQYPWVPLPILVSTENDIKVTVHSICELITRTLKDRCFPKGLREGGPNK